jgi:RNA polymerase sigma-70 factor (ECF subfamily)
MAIDAQTSRMEPAREQALVADARVDSAAFGELYDYYLPRIYGYVARRVEERSVAEDLTATTFERALGAVRGADFRNASFGGFLYRVAANAVIDHFRRERRSTPLGVRATDVDDDEGRDDVEELGDDAAARAFAAAVDRDTLRRALLQVPEAHRRVIVLKYFDGLDIDELCAALGCSRQTFAVKLHRALRALRAAVDQEAMDAA